MSTHALERKNTGKSDPLSHLVLGVLNGSRHVQALAVYMAIVSIHFFEHVTQIAQVHLLGMAPREAGGLFGEVLPNLVANESLHMSYNTLQLTGLILLAPGFRKSRAAKGLWIAAILAQTWHWLEHAFLQVQFLTGHYFYDAIKQMSVLERFFPRVELHFAYNLSVVVPTVAALVVYLVQRSRKRAAA
ncbi:MAG: hypothetical protein R6W77_01070 [Trueperaceae bacterium]